MPLILGKKHRCPDCGEIAFGCLHIHSQSIELACEVCGNSYKAELPQLRKKVVYLDQHVISLMMRSRQARMDNCWTAVFDRLEQMVHQQQIVCPASAEHRTESEFQRDLYEDLKQTYKTLAKGVRFRSVWDISIAQISIALRMFLADSDVTWEFNAKEGFEKDPHTWQEHYFIEVEFERLLPDIRRKRDEKNRLHQDALKLYADPVFLAGSFDDHVRKETEAFARMLMRAYDDHHKELARIRSGEELDPFCLLSPPPAKAMEMILHEIQRALGGQQDTIEKVGQFLFSSQFGCIPAVRINAILRAAMALKTRHSGRKPKAGDIYDLDILSGYLPYCDAMIIDGEMRSFACEGEAALDTKYNTKLFSAKTLDGFSSWLDEVEESCPEDITRAILAVYEERFDKLSLVKGQNYFDLLAQLPSMPPSSYPMDPQNGKPCDG